MKKIKYFLQKWDAIWSVPLSFLIFWFVGVGLQLLFGYGTGIYDPSFMQPIFLSATIVIGATNIAIAGMYYTFRSLHQYIYGETNKTNDGIVNYSKIDWTKLTAWQRYLVTLLVFMYYVSAILIVYLKLV